MGRDVDVKQIEAISSDALSPETLDKMRRAGLRGVQNVATFWGIESDLDTLVGLPAGWRDLPGGYLVNDEQLRRISYLFKIYRWAGPSYDGIPHAEWPTTANRNWPFEGRTPLSLMLEQGEDGMDQIVRYLYSASLI